MRIYYGWVIVAITMVILMLLVGCVSNAFGLFVLPVSQDLGLSRAEVNTGYILTTLGGAVAAPVIGRLIDVYPVRRIMLVSAVLFASGLVTVGLSQSVALSGAMLLGPVALGMGGVGAIGSLTIVARWFGVNRGRAMASDDGNVARFDNRYADSRVGNHLARVAAYASVNGRSDRHRVPLGDRVPA